MKVLLISNDYNYSDLLANNLRHIDGKLTYNTDTSHIINQLRSNSNYFDVVLIDLHVSDYSLDNILQMIRMESSNIPIIAISHGNSGDMKLMSYLLNNKIVQNIGLKAYSSASINDLLETLNKTYKESIIYR